MKPNSIINVLGVNCELDYEEKFNKWYNEIHVPMVMKFKGVKRVTRFKVIKPSKQSCVKATRGGYPNYLLISEFENEQVFEDYEASPELAEAMKETNETWANGGIERVWRVQYKGLKTWEQ